MLLVYSNSNLHDNIFFSSSRLTKIHPAPAPSLDFDPSKYKDQNKGLFTCLSTILSTTLIHLEVSICEKTSTCEVTLVAEEGDW